MWKFISNYFRSLAFWIVVIFFFAILGLGLLYDKLFGKTIPFPDWYYFSDLTTGDWITLSIGMIAIFSIPVVWIVKAIGEKRKD